MFDQAVQMYHGTMERLLHLMLQKRSKKSYIGIAISIVILQQIYSAMYVPKKLRRFPKVSSLAMIKSLWNNEPAADRAKRLVTPLTNEGHKFYLVSFIKQIR